MVAAETLSELRENLKSVIDVLTKTEGSVVSISSGCELFLRFITLASLDNPVCIDALLVLLALHLISLYVYGITSFSSKGRQNSVTSNIVRHLVLKFHLRYRWEITPY